MSSNSSEGAITVAGIPESAEPNAAKAVPAKREIKRCGIAGMMWKARREPPQRPISGKRLAAKCDCHPASRNRQRWILRQFGKQESQRKGVASEYAVNQEQSRLLPISQLPGTDRPLPVWITSGLRTIRSRCKIEC